MAPASALYPDSKTVCVMDASCRLGVALVERLLQRGYTVHAAAYAHGPSSPSSPALILFTTFNMVSQLPHLYLLGICGEHVRLFLLARQSII